MEGKIYQEVKWTCPECNHKNINTFLDIETHPVACVNCQISFDVYLKVKLDIEVLEVSDGIVTKEDKNILKMGLKRVSDSGKIDKFTALQIMSEINLTST